jgi:molecular chaperone GrpE
MLNRNNGTIWGDNGNMTFEDFYSNFVNERSLSGNLSISKQEYLTLKEKAEKFEAISSKTETLRLENKELKDVLKDLKEDARHYKELKEESENYLKSLLRVRADFENYKKIADREKQKLKLYATESILKKIISHYDDLKRALEVIETLENGESLKKGFEIIIKNFEKVLEGEGIQPMNAEGEKFDPYKHEALMCLDREDLPENTIIEELDKGYFFNKKVLRPAKVIISKKANICEK